MRTTVHTFGRRLWRRVSIALTLFLFVIVGCITEVVLWLPDSSGIVYSDKSGSRLVEFNLSKNARRVIVADTQTRTPWPAISADGKRLAVGKIETATVIGSDILTERMQIIIYDFNGRVMSRSSMLTRTGTLMVASAETKTKLDESALNWSGPTDKILTNGAIYDLKKDSWLLLEVFPYPNYNQPIRPDGKGFLACNVGGKFWFVDWDGWMNEITVPPAIFDRIWKTPTLSCFWDKHLLRFVFEDEVVEIDTISMKASAKPQHTSVLQSDWKLKHAHRFQGDEMQLCVFTDEEKIGSSWRLEVQAPASKKRRVLLTERDYEFYPKEFYGSPDGKKVAIRFSSKMKEKGNAIVIIDSTGTIVSTVIPE